MNDYFKNLFNRQPIEIVNGDYYFHTDNEGDQFDEEDVKLWLEEGKFKRRWEQASQIDDRLFSVFYDDICKTFSNKPSHFVEIACGPGMGLAPIILSKNPKIPCLATDASSLLIKSWRKFINKNLSDYDINLSSFSVMDMPFYDNSFNIVTSFIGISSTRAGEQGKMKALNEVYRILNKDGFFIAIENEWTDYNAIKKVFELWDRPIWNGMNEEKPWKEKFTECGFTIESSEKSFTRKLNKEDNDLGEQASKFGIDIELKFTLYILRKF
jgi:ubiquinone/menaquinone biosynthesis C-methylase UbiE